MSTRAHDPPPVKHPNVTKAFHKNLYNLKDETILHIQKHSDPLRCIPDAINLYYGRVIFPDRQSYCKHLAASDKKAGNKVIEQVKNRGGLNAEFGKPLAFRDAGDKIASCYMKLQSIIPMELVHHFSQRPDRINYSLN
jgi:hypothetical protein